jgi:hypothetical protein
MSNGLISGEKYGEIQGLKNHLVDSIVNVTSAYMALCDLDSHFREYAYHNGENGCSLGQKEARAEVKKLFDKYREQGVFEIKKAVDNLSSDQTVCIVEETIDELNVIKKVMIEK